MKKKYTNMISCFALLVLFTTVNFNSLKTYYDELVVTPNHLDEDINSGLQEENMKAQENREEYQKLIDPEGNNSNSEPNENVVIKDLHLRSLSALLLDAENNRVLYDIHGYDKLPMASTTKIMTCIVALENADLSDVVTVSSYAARMPDVQLNINTGEQYYLKDLLYSLMLESHNDVAVAIAEHVGGSVEGFATMMNDKARSLDCMDTNFVTPNGLDAEGHYTTARDLAVIASYAIKNEKFIEITNTSSHQFKELKKGRTHSVTNKNKFLYMMDGAIGVKTGFTSKAGYCFVGAVKKPDRTLVSVVLGCGWPPNKSLKWSETSKLMNYGMDNYEKKQIFEQVKLDPIYVEDGQVNYVPLKLEGDLSLLLRKDEVVKVEYDYPKQLEAPVLKDQQIGSADYYINGTLYEEIPIYTAEEIKKIDFPFCLKKIYDIWRMQY